VDVSKVRNFATGGIVNFEGPQEAGGV